MLNARVDGITSQSSSHEEWIEFVQKPNTSSANGQSNEIVNTIFSLLMLIIQTEKDDDGVKLMNVP